MEEEKLEKSMVITMRSELLNHGCVSNSEIRAFVVSLWQLWHCWQSRA